MAAMPSAKAELRDFLLTRRARITPQMAGLPSLGTVRRVPGLRREEVAALSGISTEYYVRLERGDAAGASTSVIDSVARVLRLDPVEREHLGHLLQAILDGHRRTRAVPRSQARRPAPLRAGLQRLIDAVDRPVLVFNRRLDIVAANRLGRLLYAPMFDFAGGATPNAPAFALLAGETARRFWGEEWETLVRNAVAELRAEAARRPDDSDLVQLIGTLSTRSEVFRRLWASHDVGRHESGVKTMHHPVVGTITMPFEKLTVAGDDELVLMTYNPEVDSPALEALTILSSWSAPAATTEPDDTTPGADHRARETRLD